MLNAILPIAQIVPPAIVVCAVGGAFTASSWRSKTHFARHFTQPELIYFQQSQSNKPAAFAAFHAHVDASPANSPVQCIDCHSGAGTLGRAVGLMQGVHDLAAYLSQLSRARPYDESTIRGFVHEMPCRFGADSIAEKSQQLEEPLP